MAHEWSQDSVPSILTMCKPAQWSWHRRKVTCARKKVWCRLFPCWSDGKATGAQWVTIWILPLFLLQHNYALLLTWVDYSPVYNHEGSIYVALILQLLFLCPRETIRAVELTLVNAIVNRTYIQAQGLLPIAAAWKLWRILRQIWTWMYLFN